MKTLIILTPGFPENEGDTTCLPAFQQFVLSLQKNYPAIEFIVIAFQYPFQENDYKWFGNRVICIGGTNRSGIARLNTWFKVYKTLRQLKKDLPAGKAGKELLGILSLWLTECALVGKYFCKRNKLKHYMWLIGQDAKATNQYIKRVKPKGEEVIAMSDFLKEELYNNHSIKPFMTAENGINQSAFPEFNRSQRAIDVLGVGSLIALKNYSLFIDVIHELTKTFPNIKAVLTGIGEEENDLKKRVKELGLENNIVFTGLVSHKKVFELMNSAKNFLHTSNYEGNSTVLMEALYSGCKVFSTQALSNSKVKNLTILSSKQEFVKAISENLLTSESKAERIVFNTMGASAKKIMDLFLT